MLRRDDEQHEEGSADGRSSPGQRRSFVLLQRDEDVTFDIGLVKSDGKADYRGAVEAWQTLLDQNPACPNATSVKNMITAARRQISIAQ